MDIGVPKEIKADENRVALTPAAVAQLVQAGHRVYVESRAGAGSGFPDELYQAAGGTVVPDAAEVFEAAELIVKVKEPQPVEYGLFRPGQVLFTYLHLAPNRELTEALLAADVYAIAYETVEVGGRLPLLEPMSQVAGRMAPQVGAQFHENAYGGNGILLGGVPGVPPAHVVVVGGGTVGENAVKIALGLGARVSVLDIRAERLRWFDDRFAGRLETVMSTPVSLAELAADADLLIGAVLVHGARAPRLVTEQMVKSMRPGSVIVDVAIDQGGCVETVDRATTHRDPVFVKHGVIHYAVANIPGAVGRTATLALTNVTLPYVLELAGKGLPRALLDNPALRQGLNVARGVVTYPSVAEAHQLPLGSPPA
ncbi:MAG: alanine dehydrogenase [Alicyclobacillaceae bacterium]|nr:alanine dehydrogenase [Alicyclobacillaceae bacterium]